MTTQSKDCVKWDTCSAGICPLDQDWQKRTHLDDDRICSLLLESGKVDAEAVFRGMGREEVYVLIRNVTPEVLSRHARIKRAYERAAQTGSRMNRMAPRTKDDVIH